jgi:hypothetical protein
MHLRKYETLAAMQGKDPNVWQLVGALIEQLGWNLTTFCNRSLLDKGYYYKAKRGDATLPTLPVLMAICVAMALDMEATEILLGAAGIKLSTAIPLHRAYIYIINHLNGEPIHVCNEFLKHLRFNDLGSQDYPSKQAS